MSGRSISPTKLVKVCLICGKEWCYMKDCRSKFAKKLKRYEYDPSKVEKKILKLRRGCIPRFFRYTFGLRGMVSRLRCILAYVTA